MTFLLDHCVWKPTAQALKRAGFSLLTLKEIASPETKNGELLKLATQRQSVLITRDGDFTNLAVYPLGSHSGIVWLDITPETMPHVHLVLCQALRSLTPEQLFGSLLIVDPQTFRLRRPPSLKS